MQAPSQVTGARPSAAPVFEQRVALFTGVLAFALALLFRVGSDEFSLDDAWIHLSYAKSLRLGEGLSYNPGDWELGSSSPLWVVMLAVWPIDGDPVWAAQLLGGLFHAVTTWLTARLALILAQRRASVDRPVPLASVTGLAGVLAATWPPLLMAAASGMEVCLAAALVLGAICSIVEAKPRLASALAALALWARPETAVCIVCVAIWQAARHRTVRRAAWPLCAVVGAATLWGAWNLALGEGPFPNTYYVKSAVGGAASFAYLAEEVFAWEPWIVSLTGVVLLAIGTWHASRDRQVEPAGILIAWFATLAAIALSRDLHLGVSFYERRYFLIVTALPCIGIALALVRLSPRYAIALLIPLVAAIGLQSASSHELTRALERDIRLLHTVPARYISEELPADATIAVEGAGAARFYTPRSMRIIDIMGLNHRTIARAATPRDRMCEIIEEAPTHLLVPDNALPPMAKVFDLTPIRRFDDPSYHQISPPRPVSVHLFEITNVAMRWRKHCETR